MNAKVAFLWNVTLWTGKYVLQRRYGKRAASILWFIVFASKISTSASSNNRRVNFLFFLLALQPPLGVVFYSPLVGFSLLAYEVS